MTNLQKCELSALYAIRQKCIECSGGHTAEVRLCGINDCPLWKWRMGMRPRTLAQKSGSLLDINATRQSQAQALARESNGRYPAPQGGKNGPEA